LKRLESDHEKIELLSHQEDNKGKEKENRVGGILTIRRKSKVSIAFSQLTKQIHDVSSDGEV